MNAANFFWQSVLEGKIPAAIPEPDGGLITVAFDTSLANVSEMAVGTRQERAKLAIYACNAAIETTSEVIF